MLAVSGIEVFVKICYNSNRKSLIEWFIKNNKSGFR